MLQLLEMCCQKKGGGSSQNVAKQSWVACCLFLCQDPVLHLKPESIKTFLWVCVRLLTINQRRTFLFNITATNQGHLPFTCTRDSWSFAASFAYCCLSSSRNIIQQRSGAAFSFYSFSLPSRPSQSQPQFIRQRWTHHHSGLPLSELRSAQGLPTLLLIRMLLFLLDSIYLDSESLILSQLDKIQEKALHSNE